GNELAPDAVGRVLGDGPGHQVARVAADAAIAPVTDLLACWDYAVGDQVGSNVGGDGALAATAAADASVVQPAGTGDAPPAAISNPVHARTGRRDEVPAVVLAD